MPMRSPDLLEMAARLALSSRHPLAAARGARGARTRSRSTARVEEPGQGVRATIDGSEARLGSAAFCGIADAARTGDDADSTRSSLSATARRARPFCRSARRCGRTPSRWRARCGAGLGLDLLILSGDRAAAVAPVAAALGIADWQGGARRRREKIAAIETLKAAGRRVLMVGDGLNDAPALAAAHVSLSPISAADLTQAQADAVFLGERLAPVHDAVVIARRARRLMRQNLWLAVIYNAVAVPIAIAGSSRR